MQLIWLSGPTGKVVSLSVTRRGIALVGLGLAALLVAAGIALHFVGLRLAVAYSPDVAQQLGGVTSSAEQARMEQVYRDELNQLRQRMGQLIHQVGELETTRARLNELLGISQIQNARPAWWGRGGPLPGLSAASAEPLALSRELSQTQQQWQLLDLSWRRMHQQWELDAKRLAQLPVGLPLGGEFLVSSGFGMRLDPISAEPSHHEGIDFVAPTGTPVLASAPGRVSLSQWAGPYGQMVEITHAENFKTRYAHLSRRAVTEGQRVQRGQLIGHLGSTGRSTGPHLHYEIEHQGRVLDPVKALAPLSWR